MAALGPGMTLRVGQAWLAATLQLPVRCPARPAFPRAYLEQTAAVMAMLAAAPNPGTLAASFRQGRRATPTIAAILGAASRTGRLATTPDGRFTLRRA